MADELTPRQKVMAAILSAKGLTGTHMNHIGSRLPLRGEAGLCYVHQVRYRFEINDNHKNDPALSFDLLQGEVWANGQVPDELAPEIRDFARQAKFSLPKHERLQFTKPRGYEPALPVIYRLDPTLPDELWEKPGKAAERLAQLAVMREHRNVRGLVEAAWRLINYAMHGKDAPLVTGESRGRMAATFLQRRTTPDGDELWLARYPLGWDRMEITEKTFVTVDPRDPGVVLCLPPQTIRNLMLVFEHIILKRMRMIREADWG
ncbi:MAG TPA: hypothetical protein VMU11_01190 [Verrucomicrobiae bacterium]|nr:hypothetical protein [Verrucomicrobiae bacterium]